MDVALGEMTVDQLERELADISEASNALHARSLAIVGELNARQSYRADGCRNMTDWLVLGQNIAHATAWQWTQTADSLRDLPHIAKAFATGEVSFDQTRLLARIATPETDEGVLADFGQLSVAQLEFIARKRRTREEATKPSTASIRFDGNDTIHVSARIVGDEGGIVAVAFARECQRIFDERKNAKGDQTTVAERTAEALVNLCRQRIIEDSDPDRAQIVVHIPHSDDALPEIDGAGVICRETLERLACDARVQVVIDHNGTPIGISSTQRTAPPHIARLIRRRDRGCRFPGCGAKRFVHIHHVHYWENGGPTAWENLLSLCPHHHKLVHEHAWRVSGDVLGQLTFTSPYGVHHTSDPPLVT